MKGVPYEFRATPWQYKAPNGWYFVSMPETFSKEIRDTFINEEEGWGRLKATAKIENTEWKTAIWFDTKMNTYLLPLKAEIRKKEQIGIDKEIKITIFI